MSTRHAERSIASRGFSSLLSERSRCTSRPMNGAYRHYHPSLVHHESTAALGTGEAAIVLSAATNSFSRRGSPAPGKKNDHDLVSSWVRKIRKADESEKIFDTCTTAPRKLKADSIKRVPAAPLAPGRQPSAGNDAMRNPAAAPLISKPSHALEKANDDAHEVQQPLIRRTPWPFARSDAMQLYALERGTGNSRLSRPDQQIHVLSTATEGDASCPTNMSKVSNNAQGAQPGNLRTLRKAQVKLGRHDRSTRSCNQPINDVSSVYPYELTKPNDQTSTSASTTQCELDSSTINLARKSVNRNLLQTPQPRKKLPLSKPATQMPVGRIRRAQNQHQDQIDAGPQNSKPLDEVHAQAQGNTSSQKGRPVIQFRQGNSSNRAQSQDKIHKGSQNDQRLVDYHHAADSNAAKQRPSMSRSVFKNQKQTHMQPITNRPKAISPQPQPSWTDNTLSKSVPIANQADIVSPSQKFISNDKRLSESVRLAFRCMQHPVVVLTTCLPPSGYRGMTISSITSVCITPQPIISFNIRRPSATLSALTRCHQFLLHTLSPDADGALVADAFADGKTRREHMKFARGWDKTKDAAWDVDEIKIASVHLGAQGAVLPWLRGKGVGKVLQCRMLQNGNGQPRTSIPVNDHLVVFAEVVGTLGGKDIWQSEDVGLGYAGRKYRGSGQEIVIKR